MNVHFFANDAEKVAAWRKYFGWTEPFERWSPLNEYSPRFVGLIELPDKAVLIYQVKPSPGGVPVYDPQPHVRSVGASYLLWRQQVPEEAWGAIQKFASEVGVVTFESEGELLAFRKAYTPTPYPTADWFTKSPPPLRQAPQILSCVELRKLL